MCPDQDHTHPDQGCNLYLGMYPDQESNSQPFSRMLQPTDPHKPGLIDIFKINFCVLACSLYSLLFLYPLTIPASQKKF